MKTVQRSIIVVIAFIFSILLTGCGKKYGENALLVKQAFEYLNDDNAQGLISLVDKGEKYTWVGVNKNLPGCIWATDIKIQVNKETPDMVYYSCTIPGAASVTINNVLGVKAQRSLSTLLSKDVQISGVIPILTNLQTGEKRMDLSDASDPFSIYLNITYNQSIDPINLNDLKTDDEVGIIVTQVAIIVGIAYSKINNDNDYFSSILTPELTAVFKEKKFETYFKTVQILNTMDSQTKKSLGMDEKEVKMTVKDDSGSSNFQNTTASFKENSEKVALLLISLLVIGIVIVNCIKAIKRVRKQKRLLIIKKNISFVEQINTFVDTAKETSPSLKKRRILDYSLMYHLENDKHRIVLGDRDSIYAVSEKDKATNSGWTLAALGKLITEDCTPEQFKASIDDWENIIIPKWNEDIDEYNRLLNILLEYQSKEKAGTLSDPVQINISVIRGQFENLREKIEGDILAYAAKRNVLPFAFYMQVMTDSQNRYDRYIRQGAIMGMIDFFMKYKDNSIIKPYFETLIGVRSDMINSDNQMSFFEVRAPKNCTAKEYAAILKEVLRCSNPTIQFCDTEELMKIAEKEIPGIMDLLVNYSLKLIDPGNVSTKGTYNFEPFLYALWYNYIPPIDVGQVNSRYHEVRDITLPNSSGLNIRLFTDPYAVIPTMFHEYCHYMEDPNEASVFLKTFAFSIKFYKKYKKANPERDNEFIRLMQVLSKSNKPDKYNALNNLILHLYGHQQSREEAIHSAKKKIAKYEYGH